MIGRGNILEVAKVPAIMSARKLCIITDKCVAPLWLEKVTGQLKDKKVCVIIIPTGEHNKTLDTLQNIWKQMIEGDVDRSTVAIALGGGVVCDIGGFAAGTFMRGIPVVHIPTTLLAQVDASIGGKTAIDFCDLKNCIGIFHPPSAVLINVRTLSTLPEKQVLSGMAEIIKHAIIADRMLLKELKNKNVRSISDKEWVRIVSRSVEIKKAIVKQDEQERNGIRKQLNFGHTVGHAIESLRLNTEHPLLHGEAVALGMISEAHMSVLMGILSQQEEDEIIKTIQGIGLPTKCTHFSTVDIKRIMKNDKKNTNGQMLFSLPLKIGKVNSDCIVPDQIIEESLQIIMDK